MDTAPVIQQTDAELAYAQFVQVVDRTIDQLTERVRQYIKSQLIKDCSTYMQKFGTMKLHIILSVRYVNQQNISLERKL